MLCRSDRPSAPRLCCVDGRGRDVPYADRFDSEYPTMFERVLFPTDGSEHAKRAVDRGFDLVDEVDAAVHILHVATPVSAAFGFVDPDGSPSLSQASVELQEAADLAVEAFAERARARGIESETAIRRGVPPATILTYADEHGIDLIVMSTRGMTGFTQFGSVTKHVLQGARDRDLPVLVV